MKPNIILFLLLILPFMGAQAGEKRSYQMPDVEVIPILDTATKRQYELYIKLPEGYVEGSDVKYPVIYMTDAVWHIELLSAATAYMMENAVLVGISWQTNIKEELKRDTKAHASRFRDYSMKESDKAEDQAKYQFGQASTHLQFIRDDVIHYVERHYQADPKQRTYFGYSFGGLFGAYILMAQPDTFAHYILGSPSLWNDIPDLTKLGSNKTLNANVFLSYGTEELDLGARIKEFSSLLNNRSDKNLSVETVVIKGSHQTAFPGTGIRSIDWLSSLNKEGEK